MGYFRAPNGTMSFEPDDTETEMYLISHREYSMKDILDKIKEKWGDVNLDDVVIGSEYIHTECTGYDLHDSSDWTDCIVITYNPKN